MAKSYASEGFYPFEDPLEAAFFSVLIEILKKLDSVMDLGPSSDIVPGQPQPASSQPIFIERTTLERLPKIHRLVAEALVKTGEVVIGEAEKNER
jgi:hypothetical protein